MTDNIKILHIKLVESYKRLRALEAKVREEKETQVSLQADFLQAMELVGTTTYNSGLATISMVETEVARVQDWEQLYSYIKENNAFDLLQRRVSNPAWRDRLENEEKLDFIEPFTQKALRVTVQR